MKKIVLIFTAGLFMIQAKSQNLKQAIAYTDNELFETSAQTFYKLLAAKPNDAELLYYMGENFYGSERLDSAQYYYEKGLAANPQFALNYVGKGKLALEKGNLSEAQGLFAKARELSNNKNAEVLIEIAEAYVLNGKQSNMTAAMEALTIAEKLDAKNIKTYLLLGDAQLILDNDGSKAIGYYDKAVELAPTSPLPSIHIGALYERSKANDLAFQEYDNAIKKDSTYAPSYRMLGDLYYKYNRPKEATQAYEKYLKLSGYSFSASVRYAKFLFLAKDYEKAIEQMEKLIKQDPTLNVLNRLLAYSYFETKQYDMALIYIETYLANADKYKSTVITEDYSYYGKTLASLGKDSLAIIQLEKAISMDTTVLATYTDLANSYKKVGKPDMAVKTLNTKIKRSAEPSINDFFALGQLLYAQGMALKTDSVAKTKTLLQADSVFTIVTEKAPTEIIGFVFRAKANVGMDPKTTAGLAKPHYEKIVEMGAIDPVKNKTYLLEANYYLAYLYYVAKDKPNALKYVDAVLAIDANHEQAKKLKELINKYLKDPVPGETGNK